MAILSNDRVLNRSEFDHAAWGVRVQGERNEQYE